MVIFLVLLIILYILNGKSIEKYESSKDDSNLEDLYFGILPKENHKNRLRNLLYYNDPIFLEHNKRYFVLDNENSLVDFKEALLNVLYITPKKYKLGLSPIEYNESIELNTYPRKATILNKKELIISPYSRPINNQQPYIEMGDFVIIKTKENEYVTVKPVSNSIELVNTKDIPNNAVFKILGSPQCYINYKKYGIDNRNKDLTTLKIVMNEIMKELNMEEEKLKVDEEKIKNLQKKQVELEENILKLENNVEVGDLELDKYKLDYENQIAEIREVLEKKKIELKRDLENKKQLAEGVFDEKYIQEMKNIVNRGC